MMYIYLNLLSLPPTPSSTPFLKVRWKSQHPLRLAAALEKRVKLNQLLGGFPVGYYSVVFMLPADLA